MVVQPDQRQIHSMSCQGSVGSICCNNIVLDEQGQYSISESIYLHKLLLKQIDWVLDEHIVPVLFHTKFKNFVFAIENITSFCLPYPAPGCGLICN